MSRPPKKRRVNSWPGAEFYKPRGMPLSALEIVRLTVDEYEAMRLHDCEELDHSRAAEKMKISRVTFGRILNSAHRKIAEALTHGKAIRIEGGNYQLPPGWGAGRGWDGGGRGRRGWRGGRGRGTKEEGRGRNDEGGGANEEGRTRNDETRMKNDEEKT